MADGRITVLARLRTKAGMEEDVKQECMSLIEPTRGEAGCISYDLHQGVGDPSLLMFYENWTSKETLDEHLQKPYLQAFVAKAKDVLAEPLDVTIWEKLS